MCMYRTKRKQRFSKSENVNGEVQILSENPDQLIGLSETDSVQRREFMCMYQNKDKQKWGNTDN